MNQSALDPTGWVKGGGVGEDMEKGGGGGEGGWYSCKSGELEQFDLPSFKGTLSQLKYLVFMIMARNLL